MSEYSLIHWCAVMTRARPLPPAERRASLIAATRQLILDHGPEVTTRQVAEAAKVAEGTLFRVFPTRRDLIAATIADHLSPERLADILRCGPRHHDRSTRPPRCVCPPPPTTSPPSGVFIPRPHRGGDQDEIRFRIMELWEARVCDIANWMRDRLAPHEAELTIPVKDFAHLVITLAMGYAHGRSPDTSLNPATLARLALDGARRKESH